MSKQTATDYLIQEIKNDTFIHSKSTKEWNEIFRKAKQMEREQIEDAYWEGGQDIPYSAKQCEQHYNETYGGHSVDANEMIDHNGDVNEMVGGQDEK